jgi:hypothetical protein
MELTRDLRPFLLAHRFQIGRQRAQAFIRFCELHFGRQALLIRQGILDGDGRGRRKRHEHFLITNGEALAVLFVADVKIAQHLTD